MTDKPEPAKPAKETPAPLSPITALRREIDRLFDQVAGNDWRLPMFGPRGFDLPALADWKLTPPLNVKETDKAYVVSVELPGMQETEVEVKVAGGMLTIKGEKSEEKQEDKGDYHVSERHFGEVRRSLRLPEGIDATAIAAEMRNGVLTVTVPKSQKPQDQEQRVPIRKG